MLRNRPYKEKIDHLSCVFRSYIITKRYAITGFAYGMREIDTSKTLTRSSEIMVKNNFTGKYESLSCIVVTE